MPLSRPEHRARQPEPMRPPRPGQGRETLARVRGVRAERSCCWLSFPPRRFGGLLLGAGSAEKIRHPVVAFVARVFEDPLSGLRHGKCRCPRTRVRLWIAHGEFVV